MGWLVCLADVQAAAEAAMLLEAVAEFDTIGVLMVARCRAVLPSWLRLAACSLWLSNSCL